LVVAFVGVSHIPIEDARAELPVNGVVVGLEKTGQSTVAASYVSSYGSEGLPFDTIEITRAKAREAKQAALTAAKAATREFSDTMQDSQIAWEKINSLLATDVVNTNIEGVGLIDLRLFESIVADDELFEFHLSELLKPLINEGYQIKLDDSLVADRELANALYAKAVQLTRDILGGPVFGASAGAGLLGRPDPLPEDPKVVVVDFHASDEGLARTARPSGKSISLALSPFSAGKVSAVGHLGRLAAGSAQRVSFVTQDGAEVVDPASIGSSMVSAWNSVYRLSGGKGRMTPINIGDSMNKTPDSVEIFIFGAVKAAWANLRRAMQSLSRLAIYT
jgi:hypothetical protein